MPSLLNTDVAANYGRMVPQTTVSGITTGVQPYSNFGTRQLRLISVAATANAVAVNFTDATYVKLSKFSVSVRALQTVAEIYQVFKPGTAGFIAAIAEDTANDSDTGTNAPGGYGDAEAAIAAALLDAGATAPVVVTISTMDVDATGIALA